MSGSGGFLGRALASRESAYFLQQSKNAVGNLIARKPNSDQKISPAAAAAAGSDRNADVLPEILRHSLPLAPPSYSYHHHHHHHTSPSAAATASRWTVKADASPRASDGVFNPLRDYVSFPQTTFGPRRWSMPPSQVSGIVASTANELRSDRDVYVVNPEKLKAASEGLAHVGKAFAVATFVVFGGVAFASAFVVSKLQLRTTDDIKTKGHEIFHPKFEILREQMIPLREQVEIISRKWRINGEGEIKEQPVIKELSKILAGGVPK